MKNKKKILAVEIVAVLVLLVVFIGLLTSNRGKNNVPESSVTYTEMTTEEFTYPIETIEITEEETKEEVKSEEKSEEEPEKKPEEVKSESAKPETPPAQIPVQKPIVTPSTGGHIVAIDAGHQLRGNSEKEPIGPGASTMKAKVTSGATGVSTGIPEYQLNLEVALMLRDELVARGYQVVMIRETNDVNLSNSERAAMANNSGAEIFIRLHGNSSSSPSASGTLTMCMSPANPYVAHLYNSSKALSMSVVNNMVAMTGAKNRGVMESDTMSGINWCTIPVTIVEMGFMSNATEDNNMATQSYRQLMVAGMANGIDEYFGY